MYSISSRKFLRKIFAILHETFNFHELWYADIMLQKHKNKIMIISILNYLFH